MKIRPWIFEDKEVTLKWLGNLTTRNNQWFIRAGFEYNNQIEFIELPFAALPFLKIGAQYMDGQILEHKAEGIVYDVVVPRLEKCKVTTSLDACKSFGYYLFAKPELMSQLVFEFSLEGKTYYLPQFEFVRAIFAINKIMTNTMMAPNRLEFLVTKSDLNEHIAFLELADEIPNNIVNDENFIRYFAWLYFSPNIKSSFESIYTLLAPKISNKEYLRLEVYLPAVQNTFIRFRGIEKDNKYLILQWLGSDMEGTTFADIEVKHRAFKKRVDAPGRRKYRKSTKEDDGEKVLNEETEKRSKQDANQPVVDTLNTQLQFSNLANVHKVYESEQQVNRGDIYISNQGQGGGIQQEQVVGIDESIYGGIIQPIDFKILEVTEDIRGQGLEMFIRMVQLLATENNRYQVSMTFIYLPLGRKFSYINSNMRRIACIVRILNQLTNRIQYVIEIATPDNKSLSTLLVYQTEFTEEKLLRLIKKLVIHSGTWSKDILMNIECEKIKHTSHTLLDWKNKLIMKLK